MRKKHMLIGASIFLILVAMILGGWLYYYTLIERSVNKMQITFEDSEEHRIETDEVTEAFTVLLLGIGDRPKIGDAGRADSIIVASVNPKEKHVLMFNVPRDSRVEIVGKGIMDKINHAYAFGGTEMMKKTVEQFLDQPIHYVIQTNMEGLTQLVDVFGGIEVYNEFAFDQMDQYGKRNHHFDQGLIQLDGERALHYTRMRKSDARGDLGRNDRQRQVIKVILDKAASASSVLKLEEVLKVMEENVKTNITFDKMKQLYSVFSKDWSEYEIESLEVAGSSQMIDGIYYYQVSEQERERVASSLREHTQGADQASSSSEDE